MTLSLFTVHYVISCNAGLLGHSLFADRFPRHPFLLSLLFTSRGLYTAPRMDLQGYILSVINLIYKRLHTMHRNGKALLKNMSVVYRKSEAHTLASSIQ